MTNRYNTASVFIYNLQGEKERVQTFRYKDLHYFFANIKFIRDDYTQLLLNSKFYDKVEIYVTFYDSFNNKYKQCMTLYKMICGAVNYYIKDLEC